MEHRWGHRRSTDVKVRFATLSDRIGSGRITNFSPSGAFMETTAPLRRLAIVYLEPAARSSVGRLAAIVVRQTEAGVGVEWCESGARYTALYRRLSAGSQQDADSLRPVSDEGATTPLPGEQPYARGRASYWLEFTD